MTASQMTLEAIRSVPLFASLDDEAAKELRDLLRDKTVPHNTRLFNQGDKGDQWILYWNESTQLKNELAVGELKPGDSVDFEFVERTGKKFLTELRRTHKADND